jgi:hypothetical protein
MSKLIGRFRFHGPPMSLRRCRVKVRDDFGFASVGTFDLAELGPEVCRFSSDDYVVAVDEATGDLVIYHKPRVVGESFSTDDDKCAPQTPGELNAKLRRIWHARREKGWLG